MSTRHWLVSALAVALIAACALTTRNYQWTFMHIWFVLFAPFATVTMPLLMSNPQWHWGDTKTMRYFNIANAVVMWTILAGATILMLFAPTMIEPILTTS